MMKFTKKRKSCGSKVIIHNLCNQPCERSTPTSGWLFFQISPISLQKPLTNGQAVDIMSSGLDCKEENR